MSSTHLTEQQFDEAWEGYQDELHACPSPVRQELNESLAARVQAGQGKGTIYQPISEYLEWLYADLSRLDHALANSGQSHHPDTDELQHADSLAALRVYSRFVKARLEQGA